MPPFSKRYARHVAFFAVAFSLAAALLLSGRRGCAASRGAWGYQVIDGDTITVDGVGTVRYIGVDAPERGQAFYDAARRFNADLLARGRIDLRFDRERRDKYGRTLAYVYVRDRHDGELFVNLALVRGGYARVFAVPPNVRFNREFREAENDARDRKNGMWRYSDR